MDRGRLALMPERIRTRSFIRCYGLFWSADEVEWYPVRMKPEERANARRGCGRRYRTVSDVVTGTALAMMSRTGEVSCTY